MYANRDIILLDDPLSAVDARVGRFIFDKCICGLLKDKICVLATHQVQFLPAMSHILLLKDEGSVSGYGSFSELVASGHALVDELHSHEDIDADEAEEDETPEILRKPSVAAISLKGKRESDGRLIMAESKSQGKVAATVYKVN